MEHKNKTKCIEVNRKDSFTLTMSLLPQAWAEQHRERYSKQGKGHVKFTFDFTVHSSNRLTQMNLDVKSAPIAPGSRLTTTDSEARPTTTVGYPLQPHTPEYPSSRPTLVNSGSRPVPVDSGAYLATVDPGSRPAPITQKLGSHL